MSILTVWNSMLCSLPCQGRLRTPSLPSGIATRGRLVSLRPDSYWNTRAHVFATDADLSRSVGIGEAMLNGEREKQVEWLERELEGAGYEGARCGG